MFQEPHLMISHQFYNALNNLTKEAIYMGIPLVHNAPPYKEVGYYYEDYDALTATELTKEAINIHSPKKAAQQGQEFLNGYSIYNLSIQETYQKLLEDVLKK